LDQRLVRITVGFALQSAIQHRCDVEPLLALYADPDLEKARVLEIELAESRNHREREIAIWLQTLHEQGVSELDTKAFLTTMREMEYILYFMINEAGNAQREVNDWMNYIANAAESLADGFWIDAKIFLSQALDISQSTAVEELKSDPNLRRKLDILQRATAQYFAEIKALPSKLEIPEDRLEAMIEVQKVLLDLMQSYYLERSEGDDEVLGGAIRQLNSAIRHLMAREREIEEIREELRLISQHLKEKSDRVVGQKKRELTRECGERIGQLAESTVL